VTFAREVVKDVEDIEGDRREYAITLPVKYGIRPALALATASLLVLIVATLAAIKFAVYNFAFLYIVSIADLIMLISIVIMWQSSSPVQMKRVSNYLKLCMIVGLLAIIAGSM
jgi:geranylgeranylglycerol-phosphate geranylgeranyltransferase